LLRLECLFFLKRENFSLLCTESILVYKFPRQENVDLKFIKGSVVKRPPIDMEHASCIDPKTRSLGGRYSSRQKCFKRSERGIRRDARRRKDASPSAP